MGILRKRVMNDNAVSKAHRPLANFNVFMPFDSRERKSQLTASFFSTFCVAEGTDNMVNAFEGTTFGIGDWVLAFYSTIYSYYGW